MELKDTPTHIESNEAGFDILIPNPDLHLATSGVVLVIGFLGIVGNTLIVFVKTRRQMASPTSCFFTALAISDLLLLCVIMIFSIYEIAMVGGNFSRTKGFVLVMMYLHRLFVTTTCWLTVAVAITRCLQIRCIPRLLVLCSMARIRIVCAVIFISSFALQTFQFLPVCIDTTDLGVTLFKVAGVMNLVFSFFLPFGLLVISNAFLIHQLASHRQVMLRYFNRSPMSKTSGQPRKATRSASSPETSTANSSLSSLPQRSCAPHLTSARLSGVSKKMQTSTDVKRVTVIVLATTVCLLVCYPFEAVVTYFSLLIGASDDTCYLQYLAMVLLVTNSSMNFLFYFTISCKFRRTVIGLIR
ncbi:peptide receptor GPCR [Elysia marginata]|uniref:Peptide receptor GPCR n=1 Tax=Elysia marginata TaxID=1093978 RepID=A0AAV4F4E7_9GAST|nr:peptide receptor GPCR [Elysia marginata]